MSECKTISCSSYVIPAPGSAVIWLVMKTATLYSKHTENTEMFRLEDKFKIFITVVYWACLCMFDTSWSDLLRSSAAWRASGPVSAVAPPTHLGPKSQLWTGPWWSQWSVKRKEQMQQRFARCDHFFWIPQTTWWFKEKHLQNSDVKVRLTELWQWFPFTDQEFEDSSLFMEFSCNKV